MSDGEELKTELLQQSLDLLGPCSSDAEVLEKDLHPRRIQENSLHSLQRLEFVALDIDLDKVAGETPVKEIVELDDRDHLIGLDFGDDAATAEMSQRNREARVRIPVRTPTE